VVSAARQGASYGARIRLPHAFVMTVLFQKGTWESKIRRIVEMALVHGRNLAMYAATYKALLALLAAFSSPASSPTSHLPTGRLTQPGLLPTGSASSPLHPPSPSGSQSAISPPGRPTASWHPLVAGGIGGYVVWGAYSGVNYQVREQPEHQNLAIDSHFMIDLLTTLYTSKGFCQPNKHKIDSHSHSHSHSLFIVLMYLHLSLSLHRFCASLCMVPLTHTHRSASTCCRVSSWPRFASWPAKKCTLLKRFRLTAPTHLAPPSPGLPSCICGSPTPISFRWFLWLEMMAGGVDGGRGGGWGLISDLTHIVPCICVCLYCWFNTN
jgi:hypothetical protein